MASHVNYNKNYSNAVTTNSNDFLVRIPPLYYLHVLDQNTNVSKLVIGPKSYVRQENEWVLYGPEKMITVPPRHYCIVENPVLKDADGHVVMDNYGQCKLQHCDQEIRMAQDPFPLYPGEFLRQQVTPLKVVSANAALRLCALLDFDDNGVTRIAGEEWLFEGPGTYIPRKEVTVKEMVQSTIIGQNEALKLVAKKDLTDREGHPRLTGEQWLVKKTGAYLPGAYEEVVDNIRAYVLTEKQALHMQAISTFKDDFNKSRKNGEEWLIKMSDTETHIPNVYEEVVGVVDIITLSNRQYCIILDPVDVNGHPQLGRKKLVKGEKSFFLMPGERLQKGIQNLYILGEDEGLILRATEKFTDQTSVLGKRKHSPDADSDDGKSQEKRSKTEQKERNPGDKWMIRGPAEYVPPVEVEVVTKKKKVPTATLR